MRMLALLVFLVACKGGGETGASTQPERCAASVDKIMGKGPSGDRWAQKSDAEKQRLLALRDGVAKAVAESCRTLGWSKQMHDCVEQAEDSKAGLRACDELLTPAQTTAVNAALDAPALAAPKADPQATRASAVAALEALEQQRAELMSKLAAALQTAEAARSPADQKAALVEETKLEIAVGKLETAIVEAKLAVQRADDRHDAVTPSKECLANPLAKGCM